MARKNKMPGLYQRTDGYWQIDKRIRGFGSVRESTGTQDYTEAERRARARIAELEQAARYGVRMRHTFAEAAKKYIEENGHKRALDRDARDIAQTNADLPNVSGQLRADPPAGRSPLHLDFDPRQGRRRPFHLAGAHERHLPDRHRLPARDEVPAAGQLDQADV
jgi:hypothetical protein